MNKLRAIFFTIIAVCAAFLYLHYRSLEADLAAAQADLATTKANLNIALDAAKVNLNALQQAEDEHRATLAILNDVHATMAATTSLNRALELEISASDASMDGDVAPVLESLRKTKFGGAR